MSKQRECAWRREVVRKRTETPAEERRRRENIKKHKLDATWALRTELLEKRKAVREELKEKAAQKEKHISENRNARLALRRKAQQKKHAYRK